MEKQKKPETTEKPKGGGWTLLLLVVSVITTLGTVMPVGYCLSVVNTPAEFIKAWCKEALSSHYGWSLTENQIQVLWASIVSVFLVGGICGSFGGAWCCNRFGRKGCLLVSEILLVVAGLLFAFCHIANSVEMLLVGRFVGGLAAALIYTAHPMYLMEIAPQELRGSVGVFTVIGVCGGICVGQIFSLQTIFGTASLWQYAFSFYTVFVVLCLLSSYWFPESPRWLYIVKGNTDAAKAELTRLRGAAMEDRANAELSEMAAQATDTAEKTTFMAVFKNSELMLPMLLVCSIQASQQLSGINAMFYYSMPIYKKAGFSTEASEWLNLGAGFLNLAVTTIGPYLMATFNRRPLLLLSCGGCACCLFGMSFALFYIDFATWLPVFCMFLIAAYITLFEIGLGPIAFFMGTELFEVPPRPVAMSMGSLCSWSGNFMIGMFFPIAQQFWGSFAFMPCCIVCIYCLLLTWVYLPESRGRDASELKPLMKDGFKSKIK